MTDSRFKEQALYDLEHLSKDDAQKQKNELEAERMKLEGSPATRIAARSEARRQEQTRGMSGLEKITHNIKEFVGRGPQYDYTKKLDQIRVHAASTEHAVKNMRGLVGEYTLQRKETLHKLRVLQRIVGCNYVMIQDLTKSQVELENELDAASSQSLFGGTVGESMQAYTHISDIAEQLIDLHAETNQYAIEIQSLQRDLEQIEEQCVRAQEDYADLSAQHIRFQGRLREAETQERIVKGLAGVAGTQELYEQCAILADEIQRMGEQLRIPLGARLPREDLIPTTKPSKPRIAGKEYWQEHLGEILPSRYRNGNGSNGAPPTK